MCVKLASGSAPCCDVINIMLKYTLVFYSVASEGNLVVRLHKLTNHRAEALSYFVCLCFV